MSLAGAKIDGFLSCADGEFTSNGQTPALNASYVEVKGVNLREGFKADGGLSLQRAKIDGSLDCDGGQFIGKGETQPVFADSAKIEGWVLFRGGFAAEGEVNFVAAYAARGFQWLDAKSIERVVLDPRYFKVGVLRNSQNTWPTQGHLFVGAFSLGPMIHEGLKPVKLPFRPGRQFKASSRLQTWTTAAFDGRNEVQLAGCSSD